MIKIERDNGFLFIVFVLIFIFLFFFIFLLNHFFKFELNFVFKIVLVLTFSFVSLFFLKVTVCLNSKVIYFKNIYGFTLNKIDLKEVIGVKVYYNNLPFNSLLWVFGSKYNKMIEIKLDLKKSKKYNINGQFFSKVGLEKILRIIK